ncbi:hypothetical protein [Microvirga arabica]|uniref:Uncharacterized protein n=1 Tax=Microvirga arabica TaxID=1128671 RepID=A0ABV6YHW8_9HYPH|nr:hypothetical protein [Microvirga arabica]MBM1174510.1 hypothetical protein [Microvirga arabica]
MLPTLHTFVIAGHVPVISLRKTQRSSSRDGRDRPGHDKGSVISGRTRQRREENS